MKKEYQLIIAKKVYALRQKANLSQETLSYMLKLSRNQVTGIEGGNYGMSIQTLLKLCKILNCTPNDILPTKKEFTPDIFDVTAHKKNKIDKKIASLQKQLKELKTAKSS